jgi:hypothetical protein
MTLSLDSLGGYFSRWVKKATGQSRSLVEWYREKKKEKEKKVKKNAQPPGEILESQSQTRNHLVPKTSGTGGASKSDISRHHVSRPLVSTKPRVTSLIRTGRCTASVKERPIHQPHCWTQTTGLASCKNSELAPVRTNCFVPRNVTCR